MGESVTDVAHAPQHDVDADEAEQGAGQRRDEQALLEEGEGEWFEEDVHQPTLRRG